MRDYIPRACTLCGFRYDLNPLPNVFVFETLENVVQSEEESSIECKDSRKSEMSGLMDVSWDTSTWKWLEEVDDFIHSTQEIRRNVRKKTVSNSPRVFGLVAGEWVQPKLQLSRRICSVRAPSTYGQWKSSTERINCLRCGRKCGKLEVNEVIWPSVLCN